MEMWASRWTDALGENVEPYLRTIESEIKKFGRKRGAPLVFLGFNAEDVLQRIPIPENVPQAYLKLAARFNELQYLNHGLPSAKQLRDIYERAASAACSSGGGGPSSNPGMNERIGVDSVAARDHGSSAGHFQGLSQDTSRTMTEHGQASSRENEGQGPGSSTRENRGCILS
ncbi:hypothetical protein SeMB42_g05600 [Synchytrium endobioticum]|nr:hypothetical protein SeMB42_g05600 [Synchytrium endobioticum]